MISSQLNRYKRAIGNRSRKSDPGSAMMSHTRNTAIGTDRSITTRSRVGSWEGYTQATSSHIASSEGGYLAEANQVARNRNKISHLSSPGLQIRSNPAREAMSMNSNFVDHSMLGHGKSSIRRVRKLMELDRLM